MIRLVTFDFRSLLRFLGAWLTRLPWSPRRLAVALGFLVLYPLLELSVWLGFAMDAIFFRRFRDEPVAAPVFIIGNFRSGTTFMHRLLARDAERFTTMRMWEILFAPSIAQRRLVQAAIAIERRLGGPLAKLLARVERRWHQVHVMHRVSLGEPEEDEYLLLHVFSALTVGLSSGLLDQARPYAFFDSALPPGRRRRIMVFYKRCVQRHLLAHGAGSKHYLAKNPALTPKLATALEHFPDAKFILMVRDPLEVVPSFHSLMKFSWRAIGVPTGGSGPRDFLIEMQRHWYQHPRAAASALPASRIAVVDYDALVADPPRVVKSIYEQFGFEMTPGFAATLRAEAGRAGAHRSRQGCELAELGLDRERLAAEFRGAGA
jgi:hypothetical protein